MAKREMDEFDEKDLINAEFESMVEGLSLDESAPTTYLDELDKFTEVNRFTPPLIPKKSVKDQIRGIKDSFNRWKNNSDDLPPDDGAVI